MIARLKELPGRVTAAVRRVLLPAALWTAYFAGVGATWLALRLFAPRLLRKEPNAGESFWRNAEGYAPDEKDCLNQS